ncbi:MAG TPA: phosphoenolpyruvate synthase [Actinoplanes sp.]|nr:phosphoenolpyruvate synthase [Actinoplanes sp.]
MSTYTVSLSEVGKDSIALVGGKGANLGELLRAGQSVPDGFCVTTSAFRAFTDAAPGFDDLCVRLGKLDVDDAASVSQSGTEVRDLLQHLPMPLAVEQELLRAWRGLGGEHAYAVRSSATAEDLPGASFAGQYDSFLNVRTEEQLLDRVRRCWMSLFTDRVIGYRARHGFDHRETSLAVVVQRLIVPEAAGVMFTADPVSGHRRVTVINAAYGLGESVVSGLVNPDLYRIGPNLEVEATVPEKHVMTVPDAAGGVVEQPVAPAQRRAQVLSDAAIAELAAIGRRIDEHFGAPQDIEWAWTDGRFYLLQSRPVTSLFPLPPAPSDDRLHVYFSFGHQQMMTEPIRPLGLSVLRTFFPFGKRRADGESTQLLPAGGRLFFDYTDPLHHRIGRRLLARAAGAMDPRVGRAVLGIAARDEFRAHQRFNLIRGLRMNAFIARTVTRVAGDVLWRDMSGRLARAEQFIQDTLTTSRAMVESTHGAQRIAAIQDELRRIPLGIYYELSLTQVSAMISRALVEQLGRRWLGKPPDLAPIHKALPGNVTTEMGMAIGDLADLARGKPELLALLQSPPAPFNVGHFDAVPGGAEFRAAFTALLDRYGMRGAGEIDLTRPRWSEDPTQLFSGILANTRTGRAGEHRQRFRVGEQEAQVAMDALVAQVRATRLGAPKAAAMRRLLTVYRTLMALREHQKFLSVGVFAGYRRGIREEVSLLIRNGVLAVPDDADFLSLQELRDLLDGRRPVGLAQTIAARRAEHDRFQALNPPRLFTSDGEVVNGTHGGSHPEGALAGFPVSAGVVEGRARVVLRPQDAELHDGDILVARSTDPAWTPLFAAVRGIVLEIGGVMSHGAVIARELGLPTVVGIDDATRLIPDGSRIRVDGSAGFVELLRD